MRALTIMLSALSAVAISACGGLSFESNLDPNNVVEYLKPGSLEEFSDESELGDRPYITKGLVAGLSCQLDENDFIANETDARNDARSKAVALEANGIIFKQCVRIKNTPACLESVTCYGDAIFVQEEK